MRLALSTILAASFAAITIVPSLGAQAPTNDECTGALPLVYGLNAGLNNLGATPSAPAPLPCAFSGAPVNDVWWSYTATCTAPHRFSMCTSAMSDTVIEVFDGCSTLTSLACNDDFCGLRSQVTVVLSAGTTYLVRAGGWNGAVGFFDIDVEAGAGNGTQSVHTVSTCAGNLSLAVISDLHIGAPVTVALGGTTGQGIPIVAWDINPPSLPPITLSPCGCTILNERSTGFTWYVFGFTGTIPCDPLLSNMQVLVQGFELFFPVPTRPCTYGVMFLDATDTILATIV